MKHDVDALPFLLFHALVAAVFSGKVLVLEDPRGPFYKKKHLFHPCVNLTLVCLVPGVHDVASDSLIGNVFKRRLV